MSVFRHLRPAAARALFLVLAGSFVRAMLLQPVLDELSEISARVREHHPQELFHQLQQTDTSGPWPEQPVMRDVPFGVANLPLESSPGQGYHMNPQHLHDGQAHQHHQFDYHNPSYGYNEAELESSRGQGHPMQPQDLYDSRVHHYQYLHDGRVNQHEQPNYNQLFHGQGRVPRPPNNPPELFSDGAVSLPSYQYLHNSQVPQHEQADYHYASYGSNEAGQPSNKPVHGAGPSHLADLNQGGEAHSLDYAEQPQDYELPYEPYHEQVQGAGPWHLPDVKQEDVGRDLPGTVTDAKPEWLKVSRAGPR
ncbi:hypothetical protein ACQY0O_008141 [Thecaphora frezii]